MSNRLSALLFFALVASACSSDPAVAPDAGGDPCQEASEAFTTFVRNNRTCEMDDECTIIGDCGPNADFTSVRVEAAPEAIRLMNERCEATYDGPTFRAVCRAGGCLAIDDGSYCGMPAPTDSGM